MLPVFSRLAASVFALVACGAGFAVSEPSSGSPSTITGTAIVLDGDTITLGEHNPSQWLRHA
jgi:hypothetical protein